MSEQRGRVRTEAESQASPRIFLGGGTCRRLPTTPFMCGRGPWYPQYYVPLADVDQRCSRTLGHDRTLAESWHRDPLHAARPWRRGD